MIKKTWWCKVTSISESWRSRNWRITLAISLEFVETFVVCLLVAKIASENIKYQLIKIRAMKLEIRIQVVLGMIFLSPNLTLEYIKTTFQVLMKANKQRLIQDRCHQLGVRSIKSQYRTWSQREKEWQNLDIELPAINYSMLAHFLCKVWRLSISPAI